MLVATTSLCHFNQNTSAISDPPEKLSAESWTATIGAACCTRLPPRSSLTAPSIFSDLLAVDGQAHQEGLEVCDCFHCGLAQLGLWC